MVSVAVMKDSDGYCTPFGTQRRRPRQAQATSSISLSSALPRDTKARTSSSVITKMRSGAEPQAACYLTTTPRGSPRHVAARRGRFAEHNMPCACIGQLVEQLTFLITAGSGRQWSSADELSAD